MRRIQYGGALILEAKLWNTGSPACAGDDERWCGNAEHHAATSCAGLTRASITRVSACSTTLI